MKSVILALAILGGASAFAAQKDCSPVWVSANTESGAGAWSYPCGIGAKVTHRACNEGEVAYSNEMDPTGNFYQPVTIVCKNGSFYHGVANIAKKSKCKNGQVAYSNEMDPTGNFYQNVTLVCKAGRYVRSN